MEEPLLNLSRALARAAVLLSLCSLAPAFAQAPVVTLVPKPVPSLTEAGATPAIAASLPPLDGIEDDDPADAATAPIDPVRPQTHVDLDDRGARIDLWQRIRDGFALPDLDDRLVRQRERYFAGKPDYVARMTDRGSRYLFHIVEEVQRRGLPTELALLPFIESAFNPEAVSSARAAGMWQFMPATGRHFDLTQNLFRDDRRDVLASTSAALDYLTLLHKMFGDWHLALAAYNWGEGNVQRAISANRRAGRGTDYASLRMPWETRDYVPKLQAMKNIVLRPADHGLTLPVLENHPYFLVVPISRDIDVDLITRLSGLPLDQFKQLNPQINRPLVVAAGTPQLLLPYDNANTFVKSLPLHKGPLASWTAWTAPRTMKIADVARAVDMDEEELREVNSIPPRMLVQSGSTLLVQRGRHRSEDVSERIADNGVLTLAPESPPLRRIKLTVGKGGDSVAAVAKRHGVGARQVAQWNKVSPGARFAAGSTVIVYVTTRATPAAKSVTRKGTRRAATAPTRIQRGSSAARPKRAP